MIHPTKKINCINGRKEEVNKKKTMERLHFRPKALFIARKNIKSINSRIIKKINVLDSQRLIICQRIMHRSIDSHLLLIKILLFDKGNLNLSVVSFIKTRMNRIFSKELSK